MITAVTRLPHPHFHRQVRLRLLVGIAAGVGVGLLVPGTDGGGLVMKALLGYIAATMTFCLPLLLLMRGADAAQTRAHLRGLDADRSEVDVTVVLSALASLAGIALMLLGSRDSGDGARAIEAGVAVLTVACAWVATHTVYTIRYAKLWYADDAGCIDFHTTTPPRFSDFAYFAFTLGMTYATSDSDITTDRVRRVALGHSLLSYLLGTVIIASTLSLVTGLAA